MPTRPVESHDEVRHSSTASPRAAAEGEPNHPIHKEGEPGIESPSGDRMEGANGDMHAAPNPAAGGPRESMPGDKAVLPGTNEDDATQGDQDIDTAGTAHDDLSPTKSM